MTLTDNIAYGLAARGESKAARRAAAERLALAVGLEAADFEKYPSELSGGMRQRANVARALAVDPDMLFLDEPFSATDVGLRRHLQDLLIAAARERGFSVLLVTHDLAEAVRIADRIVVLSSRDGHIAASRAIAGRPGERSERAIFDQVEAWSEDPLFDELFSAAERRR
jgi:NitT/TauT family transport system ATP-binding protein